MTNDQVRAQERTVAVEVAQAVARLHPSTTSAIIESLQTIQGPFPPTPDGTIQWTFRLYSKIGFVYLTPDQDFWTTDWQVQPKKKREKEK